MRVWLHHAAALTLLFVAGGEGRIAGAQGTERPARDRDGLAAERASAEARYLERERACQERFVVTSCVDAAKRERRETLTRLRREQNQLDDKQRKARAAERTEEIRRRAAAEAQSARQTGIREPRDAGTRPRSEAHALFPRDAAASAPRFANAPGRLVRGIGVSAPDPVARGEREARSRATFDAAHRAAEAHRAEVEARNAQRAAKHKPAAPLPLPPGASAPG